MSLLPSRTLLPMMITVPVTDPPRSAQFYEVMCGPLEIVTALASHALLAFPPARTMLYLERREWAAPVEFSLQAPHAEAFEAIYVNWCARRGLLHTPPMHWHGMGQCFVGIDPDGNRVRILAPPDPECGQEPAGVSEPAPRWRS